MRLIEQATRGVAPSRPLLQASHRVLLFLGCLALAALPALGQDNPRVEIIRSIAHGVSATVRNLPPQAAHPIAPVVPLRKPGGSRPGHGGGGGSSWIDPDLQTGTSSTSAPTLGASFEGVSADGTIPPDPNLAVGPTQVVQVVNTQFAVYGKSGNTLVAPTAIHTLFGALAGTSANLCASSDGGDPIVLYDQLAGRWFISQLEYSSSFRTNLVCMAVSQSSDASGKYNVYAWNFSNYLPDYPKFGVWSDAYYMSANMFRNGSFFAGAKACAFDRGSMIAGASTVNGWCYQNGTGVYSLLPASVDGAAPPAGEPGFFLQYAASSGVGSTLNLYRLTVGNFSAGTGFSFSGPTSLKVGSFHEACGGGTCVPQAGTSQQLDSLGDRLMYRLQYRNLRSSLGYESLVVNHSVQVSSSSNQTGLRWYEIRDPNGTPTIAQQSTYAPDSEYRWMGSIAQDKVGNMALGYSLSSASVNPGIYYVGRQATDGVNLLGSETFVINGTGSQTSYSRWGDYSSMAVDPADDCTFWYTTEYLTANGNFNWHTRVASFKFPSCQ